MILTSDLLHKIWSLTNCATPWDTIEELLGANHDIINGAVDIERIMGFRVRRGDKVWGISYTFFADATSSLFWS